MRIILLEDQQLLLDSLASLINGEPDFEVVGTLTDADDMDEACARLRPDLALMDVCTGNGSSGLEAAARLHRSHPEIKLIIMTGLPDLTYMDEARKSGAFSFIYKNLNARDLLAVLRQAQMNYSTWPAKQHMPILGYNELNERELEVLRLYCGGMTRQETAEHYGLSENTVKGYIRSILSKTGYDSIAKLAMYVLSNGYVVPHAEEPSGAKSEMEAE